MTTTLSDPANAPAQPSYGKEVARRRAAQPPVLLTSHCSSCAWRSEIT